MTVTILIALLLGVPLGLMMRRQCRRIHASGGHVRWALLLLAALAGAGLGFLLNGCELPLGVRCRVVGIPIPGVFFHLEDGQWIDFVRPFPCVTFVINVCLFALLGAVAAVLTMGRGGAMTGKKR